MYYASIFNLKSQTLLKNSNIEKYNGISKILIYLFLIVIYIPFEINQNIIK